MLRDKSNGLKSGFYGFSDKYAFLFIYTGKYCPTSMISTPGPLNSHISDKQDITLLHKRKHILRIVWKKKKEEEGKTWSFVNILLSVLKKQIIDLV